MNVRKLLSVLVGIGLLTSAAPTFAQRGTGEDIGIARQGIMPERTTLQGTLEEIETGPCKRTTGYAYIGTHLFIRTADDELANVHIGNAEAVKPMVDKLTVGEAIEVDVFRTDRLEEGHYVAQTIRTDEEELMIRREDLSPFWARQRGQRARDVRYTVPDRRGRGEMRPDAESVERMEQRRELRQERRERMEQRMQAREERLQQRERRERMDTRPERGSESVERMEQRRELRQERQERMEQRREQRERMDTQP